MRFISLRITLIVVVFSVFSSRLAYAVTPDSEPLYDAELTNIENPLMCVQTVIGDNDIDLVFISSCPEEILVYEDGTHVATLISSDMLVHQAARYKNLSETYGVPFTDAWNSSVAKIESQDHRLRAEGTVLKSWRVVLTSSKGNSIYSGASVRAKTSQEKSQEVFALMRLLILGIPILVFMGLVILVYRRVVLKKKHSYLLMIVLLITSVLSYIAYLAFQFMV